MTIIFKNCYAYNCINIQKYDIIVKDGIIAEIVSAIKNNDYKNADTVIDADGLTAFPGLVDMHCHLREPGYEHKENIFSGTRAAAKGGFTSIACMPNTNPVADNVAVIRYILEQASKADFAKVYPIAAVTKGQKGTEIAEFGALKEAGAIALSDDGMPVENPLTMKNAMLYADTHDMLIISHCEDKLLAGDGVVNEGYNASICGLTGISAASEEVMVSRELILADNLNCRIHIAHISTKGSVNLIREAKKRGVKVTCETCPHYFSADDSMILNYDTNAKVNPPLRTEEDKSAIIEGIKDGTIDVIATDHAPHHENEKNVEFNFAPNGISGFETAFALSYTQLVKAGHITKEKLIELMSIKPAKILSLTNNGLNKGAIADIMFADLKNVYTIDSKEFVSKGKNTPFNGFKVYGKIIYTVVNGKIKVKNGEINE